MIIISIFNLSIEIDGVVSKKAFGRRRFYYDVCRRLRACAEYLGGYQDQHKSMFSQTAIHIYVRCTYIIISYHFIKVDDD